MSSRRVTVFGGTGFLGHRIVRHLLGADLAVRVASRHPGIAPPLFSRDVGIESVYADVNNDGSVARAVAGASAVINAVRTLRRARETHISFGPRGGRQAHRDACAPGRRGSSSAYFWDRRGCGVGFSLHP